MLRRVVLTQAAYPFDEEAFVKIITNGAFSSYAHLVAVAIKPDDGRLPPLLGVFKLIICDLCCPEERNAARYEIVRSEDQKAARRNARLIIQQLKRISPEKLIQMERDEGNVINATWKRVSHPPPAWVPQIADAQQPWGFVFYRSKEVEREYSHI
ncbi:hypothetical protein K4K59_001624 [Colletotrichum sp. SAR11_240]|nr:hypothetical protein K4K59_001624 [Colletotrichum sp. SAR11_240]